MSKIVINACFGGFGLSDAATLRYADLRGIKVYPDKDKYGYLSFWLDSPETRDHNKYNVLTSRELERNDPVLVQVVEELGAAANGDYANLVVKEIATGTRYIINEYDGNESIQTPEDTDWLIAS